MDRRIDEVAVRIRPIDGTITVEERSGGTVTVKNISHADLMSCLQKGIKESRTIRSGFLPDGCISCDVSDKAKTLAMRIPPGRIDFAYHKTVYERFPIPAMAFSITVDSDGRTSNHKLAVIADENPSPKTQIYAYPFSNTYAHCGICIGAANSLPLYTNLRTLGTLPYHILSLPNNDHNFTRDHNKLKLPYRDLLELLKDKEPQYYYDHILVPTDATLQDFIDGKIPIRRTNANAA